MKRFAAVLLVLSLAAVACGDDDGSPQPGAGVSATSSANNDKPTVTVPSGPPPTQLVIEDLIVGTGAEAKVGTQVTVHYVGVSYSTGKEFDASWNRGEPFPLRLPGNVIAGWNEGIPGMKVGGRRKLVIPPDKAYGPEGRPPVIKPNETLIFVVDLLEVTA